MSVKQRIKELFQEKRDVELPSRGSRRQFNVIVHSEIIDEMKRLATHLAVKRSVVAEHALQVGSAAMKKSLGDGLLASKTYSAFHGSSFSDISRSF